MEKSTTEMAMGLIKQVCGGHVGNLEDHKKIQHAIVEIETALNNRESNKKDLNPEKEELENAE